MKTYGTYALENGYSRICEIPKKVAMNWIFSCYIYEEIRNALSPDGDEIFNKYFLVVSVLREKILSIYNHDGKYFLMEKDN